MYNIIHIESLMFIQLIMFYASIAISNYSTNVNKKGAFENTKI